MGERLDDRFADAVRAALLAEVRSTASTSATRRERRTGWDRWRLVVAVGVAAVVVAAIVVGLGVTGRMRAVPPAAPFGGQCAAVLTSQEASDLVGVPLNLTTGLSGLASPEALSVATLGGLQCAWTGGDDDIDAVGVTITVLPAAERPASAPGETYCYGQNDAADLQYSCTFDLTIGARWYSGTLTGPTGGTEQQTRQDLARLDRILGALPAAATGQRTDTTGWWSPLGCEAVARRVDLAAALDQPGLQVEQGNGGMRSAGEDAAVDRVQSVNCILEADTDTDTPFAAEVHAYGGAGMQVTALLDRPGVRRLADVDGARVYRLEDRTDGTSELWAISDSGALQLLPGTGEATALLPAVRPLVAALDARTRAQ